MKIFPLLLFFGGEGACCSRGQQPAEMKIFAFLITLQLFRKSRAWRRGCQITIPYNMMLRAMECALTYILVLLFLCRLLLVCATRRCSSFICLFGAITKKGNDWRCRVSLKHETLLEPADPRCSRLRANPPTALRSSLLSGIKIKIGFWYVKNYNFLKMACQLYGIMEYVRTFARCNYFTSLVTRLVESELREWHRRLIHLRKDCCLKAKIFSSSLLE